MPGASVCMVVKRYPRLSETFILNEMRALERCGIRLHVVSLLDPETGVVQSNVADVRASVSYFPPRRFDRAGVVLAAHYDMLVERPLSYLRAVRETMRWSFVRRRPLLPWKAFWRAGYVAAIVTRNDSERLHAHFAHGPTAVARLAAIMAGVPFSFTTHAKDLYLSRREILREHIAEAKFVVTCSETNVEYLKSLVRDADRDKLHRIYHGIDVDAFAGRQPDASLRESRRPLVLSVGRLVPKKGMGVLLDALALLRDRGYDVRTVVVGGGPSRDALTARTEKLGLTDRVRFPGAMPHDRLVELYREATVFALAPVVLEDGDRDGIPNVLVEAMAAGVPVVSTRVSGIPELIHDGATGSLVPPRDPHALADAIADVLDHPAKAAARARAGLAFVRDRFRVWENVEQLARLLRSAR